MSLCSLLWRKLREEKVNNITAGPLTDVAEVQHKADDFLYVSSFCCYYSVQSAPK